MERWLNRIAVVTGASAGIGAAICKVLAENGMVVVGLARRVEKMETQTRKAIKEPYRKNFYTYKCDVRSEDCVKNAFAWIVDKFGGVDVLVNNAGIVQIAPLLTTDNSDIIKNTVNTNVLGIVWCTREAFRSLQERDRCGHVININSVAGHKVPNSAEFSLNIYSPSKFAVTAMTEVMRQEFLNNNTKIKVTSISPGGVKTEIAGDQEIPVDIPLLNSADVADAVLYCIQTPPHVQIHELIIKPMGEQF